MQLPSETYKNISLSSVKKPSTEAKPVEDAEGQSHVAEDGPDLEAEELHLGVVDVRLE